jgi:hypothetical protein
MRDRRVGCRYCSPSRDPSRRGSWPAQVLLSVRHGLRRPERGTSVPLRGVRAQPRLEVFTLSRSLARRLHAQPCRRCGALEGPGCPPFECGRQAAICNLSFARHRRAASSGAAPKGARLNSNGGRPGPSTQPRPESGGLGDLVGLQATRADIRAQGAAVLLNPHLLQVRIEAPLSGDHRVASGLAERRSLTAAVTYLCHRVVDSTLFST